MFSTIVNKSKHLESILNRRLIKRITNNNSIKLLSKSSFYWSDKSSKENKQLDGREPYSRLYVSGRYASLVFNVLQPKYDIDYFNYLINNINQIKLNFAKRNLNTDIDFDHMAINFKNLVQLNTELQPLKAKKEKLKKKIDFLKKSNKLVSDELSHNFNDIHARTQQLNREVWDLEEIVMPFVLNLPNDIRSDVSQQFDDQNNVMSSFEPKRRHANLNLDYMRLSYINKCLHPSIVGPHSYYLTGSGAQLQLSLTEYFSEGLRQNQFIDVSGIDFVKSAVVEATNCQDLRDYRADNCRIDRGHNSNEENQYLHLVGSSSLESVCALISKRIFNWTSDQIRLLSIGNQYEQSFQQNNTVNASIVTKEDISDNEMNHLYKLLWNYLIKLDIKCRAINCCSQQLNNNEYARYDIDVWLNSKSEWLTACQIIHYKDYIPIRLGISGAHMIDSSINLYPIIISIIEHYQTDEGSLETPECLKQYLI